LVYAVHATNMPEISGMQFNELPDFTENNAEYYLVYNILFIKASG